MSRNFSKILVACAMVVLFPLMIVGTTFAAFFSLDAVLTLDVYTNADYVPNGAFARLIYNNKVVLNNAENAQKYKISGGHTKELKIQADSHGYNFVGWYAGTNQEYSLALGTAQSKNEKVEYLSDKDVVSLALGDQPNLLAVFNLIQYENITWSYKETPTGDEKTTAPEGYSATLDFGKALPNFKDVNGHYVFKGWAVSINGGANSERYYQSADFEDEIAKVEDEVTSIKLTGEWTENQPYTVEYYNGSTKATISEGTTGYVSENYALLNPRNVFPDACEDGYYYYWGNESGSELYKNGILNRNNTDTVKVYLQKGDPISYTANITSPDGTYIGKTTFTCESGVADFFKKENWSTGHDLWTVEGVQSITFNGVVYSGATEFLNKLIISDDYKGGNKTTVELTAQLNVKKSFNVKTLTSPENNEDAYLKEEGKIVNNQFSTADHTSLDKLFNTANWQTKYTFWTVSKVKVTFNGQEYETADALATAVNNTATTDQIDLSANVELHKYYSNVKVTEKIMFKHLGNPVYKEEDLDNKDAMEIEADPTEQNDSATTTLLELFVINPEDKIVNGDGAEVHLYSITVEVEGKDSVTLTNITGNETLNEIIEKIVNNLSIKDFEEELTIKNITANFTI